MATINDFKEYRALILKNAIYNRILTSVLSEEACFYVSSVLRKIKIETKEELSRESDRTEFPKYILYDIFVKIVGNHYWIGIKYENHPIIWEYINLYQKNLRALAEFIYGKYSINPAKLDKIFSDISDDVKLFLKANSYSENFWRLGFSKKFVPNEEVSFDEEKVDEYLEELKRRNIEYRTFNNILIKLLKNNIFSDKSESGSITVQKATENKIYVKIDSAYDWRTYEEFFPICVFSPTHWNTIDSNIDKEILVGIIN